MAKQKCIILNGEKGIYTIDEVCDLLRKNNINFKIVKKDRSKNRLPTSKHSPVKY